MNNKPKFPKYFFALLVICFLLLTYWVNKHPTSPFDIQVSQMVQKNHNPTLDHLMLGVSFLGELPWSLLLVVLIGFIFFLFKLKREAYFIFSILLTGLVILGVKHFINRPRPSAIDVRIVESNKFESFPSGHVMSYVVFFGFMIYIMLNLKKINFVFKNFMLVFSGLMILTIPFSRVYLGAHWITDTLGGIILGLICLIPLCYWYKKRNGDET